MDIEKILKDYDEDSENVESFSWCVGAQREFDLSQFAEDEILFTEEFDTYCVKHFCGRHTDCISCKHFKNAKITR